jgi:hypothetical protein
MHPADVVMEIASPSRNRFLIDSAAARSDRNIPVPCHPSSGCYPTITACAGHCAVLCIRDVHTCILFAVHSLLMDLQLWPF